MVRRKSEWSLCLSGTVLLAPGHLRSSKGGKKEKATTSPQDICARLRKGSPSPSGHNACWPWPCSPPARPCPIIYGSSGWTRCHLMWDHLPLREGRQTQLGNRVLRDIELHGEKMILFWIPRPLSQWHQEKVSIWCQRGFAISPFFTETDLRPLAGSILYVELLGPISIVSIFHLPALYISKTAFSFTVEI